MAQGRRRQTDTGTHRIYTVTRHQGWAERSFLSRFRDEGWGRRSTDFPKAPGSCPGLTPRLRCRIAGPFPCSGTPFSLATVGSRGATPEPDALSSLRPPICPSSPSEPAGASAGVRDSRGRSVTRPACGTVRRSRPSAAAPTAARTRVPSVRPSREGRDRRRRPHLSGAVRLYSGFSAAARAPPHPPSRK
ncbi:hypothetical protein HispidOSU_012005 [Sigmodon hispidus]